MNLGSASYGRLPELALVDVATAIAINDLPGLLELVVVKMMMEFLHGLLELLYVRNFENVGRTSLTSCQSLLPTGCKAADNSTGGDSIVEGSSRKE